MSMVFGSGVVANRFMDFNLQKHWVIFSDNICRTNDLSAMASEEMQLKMAISQNPNSHFVYFSSLNYKNSSSSSDLYLSHKIKMEVLVKELAKNHHIIRLPEVIGNSENSSLICSYINASFSGNELVIGKNTLRNFIDVDDVYLIVHHLLNNDLYLNSTIDIANSQNINDLDLIEKIEHLLKVKANYNISDETAVFDFNIEKSNEIAKNLNIDFENNYLNKCIMKYWGYLTSSPLLISIIVPTYNEENGIEEFYKRTKAVMKSLSPRFNHELIFVNDYSTDKTILKLQSLAKLDQSVKIINFSRNFGNQMGITAGIDYSKGDIVIVIDDDLQDPPEVILNFLALWSKGFKVVYGVRPKRQGVNFFFKLLAKMYYRIMSVMSETIIPNDTGDFRLIDRIVIEKLKLLKEENRYYRGMVAWVGYPQKGWLYDRDKRYAGTSTFSLIKYIKFAFNGLTSFSDKPLYFSSLIGLIITLTGFSFAVVIILNKLINPEISIRGWTSLSALIIFFGGVQLLSIGIVGIYISKIYREVKSRPLYLVESTSNCD